MDRLFTEKEVAELTSLSLSKIQKDRFEGTGIAYVRLGRAIRYKESDVSTFIEDNRVIPEREGGRHA